MAKQDGTANPFDGSGGGSGGMSFQQASASRQQSAGSDPMVNVPPGGPLPFTAPITAPGPLIAGTPRVALPVSFKAR